MWYKLIDMVLDTIDSKYRMRYIMRISISILGSALIYCELSLMIAAIWITWTFALIHKRKKELIVTQTIWITIMTTLGLYLSNNYAYFN